MDTTSLQSTLNKAREQFKGGLAKACVETLDGALPDLKIGEPEWYRLRNDVTRFLSKANWLERERGYGVLSEHTYVLEGSRLLEGTMILLLDFEAAVKEMEKKEKVEEPRLYQAELVLDLDYEMTDIEEVKFRISKIEHVLNLGRGLTETRAGSVIVKLNLYAEELVKIKSLVKLGLMDDVVSFEVLDVAWGWIEKEAFVLQLAYCNLKQANLGGRDLSNINLSKVDLSGANLTGANLTNANLTGADLRAADLIGVDLIGASLIGADLSNANLSGANLSGANLSRANLWVADLRGADLRGANLRRANLREADLRCRADLTGADLRLAILSGADLVGAMLIGANLAGANLIEANLWVANLSKAYLSGADLSGAVLVGTVLNEVVLSQAVLNGAIFHINQTQILEKMNEDISEVIFIDDDGKNVKSLVVVG